MAQVMSVSTASHPFYCPSSPDPTPLRLLAFSVAEAALQPDPNSPSIMSASGKLPHPLEPRDWSAPPSRRLDAEAAWASVSPWNEQPTAKAAASLRRKPLWDMVNRATERRDEKFSPASDDSALPQSPPSPSGYNFVLPPNSPLAASIAVRTSPSKGPRVLSPTKTQYFPLYTRSAEPSPTKSTFSGLDQSRPPPEFQPRQSAVEFAERAQKSSASTTHTRTKSDISSPASRSDELPSTEKLRSQRDLPMLPSRHTMRLPSLKQIQAKMTDAHRREASVPPPIAAPVPVRVPSARSFVRTAYRRADSEDSVEVIQTPTDESPRRNPHIVLASILSRRPATPPSPTLITGAKEKEPRLAPFLRERTSGRLSGGRARPMSMPPMSLGELPSFEAIMKANSGGASGPAMRITPPKERVTSPVGNVPSPTKGSFPWTMNASGMCTPTEGRFSLAISGTPPRMVTPSPRRAFTSPASPTDSIRSMTTASPTLSVPMITCTPAPVTITRDGVQRDSYEVEGDVVLFEGDSMSLGSGSDSEADAEELKEKEEREKRAEAMKQRLLRRRRSD
ncbi:hypothetical protein IAU60_003496 [Kwoniella sp. DSM 27419]